MAGEDGKKLSEDGLETLKAMYIAFNGGANGSPFPELDCSGDTLKELVGHGFLNYKTGGVVSITLDGEKVLKRYF